MTYNYIKTLYEDVLKMIANLVVKRNDLAKNNETLTSYQDFELYLACLNGSRKFNNFSTFNIDILKTYLEPSIVYECSLNPNMIPEGNRTDITEAQSVYVINHYIENNEYYRMLNGLPKLDDLNFIYVKNRTDVDPDIPIHKLDDNQISHLLNDGTIAALKVQYPDATYLDYLGTNKIDIIKARLSKPFEILRIGVPSNGDVTSMFNTEYYKARRYIMARLYHSEYFSDKTLYDPIMGVLILTLAIRNTLSPTEKEYLNFEEILNAILESYGLLTYFEKFPFSIKKRLVLDLDNIISAKGTDGVLIDICKLFDFDDFGVNRYYLMKTYKKDDEGNIIFNSDPNEQFDLNFIKADIESKEIDYSSDNKITYETVTESDPLWQLSDEEKTNILNSEFNLLMTKYVDIEAAYDVTNLVFEVCCFTNLLLYTRTNLAKIVCNNKYSTDGSSSVFTMVLFWLAAMAKRSNFDGNIIYSPNELAEVMQFNYNEIDSEVQAIIDKYELRIDVNDKLLSDYEISMATINQYINANDTIAIYVKNRALYNAILKEMSITEDVQKYMVLSELKDLLYASAMEEDTFRKTDGTAASTYYDMLKDLDPTLTDKLDSTSDESELNNLIIYILEKLEEVFNSDELKYLFLNTPSAYGALLNTYLQTAINVFKASSVQLRAINIYFYLGEHEPMRIIDQNVTHGTSYLYDNVTVTDSFSTHETIYIDDYINIGDKPYIS